MPIIVYILCYLLLSLSPTVQAKPDIYVDNGYTLDGFARSRVKNNTIRDLACTMSIDGYKIKYVLPAKNTSRWYTATKKNYNHTHFSTWCGYLVLYPEYEKYRVR